MVLMVVGEVPLQLPPSGSGGQATYARGQGSLGRARKALTKVLARLAFRSRFLDAYTAWLVVEG
jgi:hypothetical protein